MRKRTHGVDAVHDQVDQDLLQLHGISAHAWQISGKIGPQGNVASSLPRSSSALCEANRRSTADVNTTVTRTINVTITIPAFPSEETLAAWDKPGATVEGIKLAEAMPV